jgi:hypothetical protein
MNPKWILIHDGKENFEVINTELHRGIQHEKEHTHDRRLAMRIAIDHLMVIPDYYSRIDAMIKQARKDWRI